jgi:hypothetical protein
MVNPVYRVYFWLRTASGSATAAQLQALELPVDPSETPRLIQVHRQSKGSSHQPPFTAWEIGFELPKYNTGLAELGVARLCAYLEGHKGRLHKLTNRKDVTASFVININSKSSDQRPVAMLNRDQIALLAKLGASVAVDGYLMF